jgi:hypothetical protein
MKWLEALKKWNQGNGKWCIPKIGSEGHKAVRAMMEGKEAPKAAASAAPKKRIPKAPKAAEEFPPTAPQLKPIQRPGDAQPALPSKKVQEKIKKVLALNQ